MCLLRWMGKWGCTATERDKEIERVESLLDKLIAMGENEIKARKAARDNKVWTFFLWLPRHFHQKQYDIYIMTLVVCICISFPQERKATQRYSQNQKKNVKYAQWTNNRIIFFSHLQTSSETKRIKQQTKRERKPLTNEEFLISLKKQEKRYMTVAVFGRKHNEQFALLSHGNIIYREMRVR